MYQQIKLPHHHPFCSGVMQFLLNHVFQNVDRILAFEAMLHQETFFYLHFQWKFWEAFSSLGVWKGLVLNQKEPPALLSAAPEASFGPALTMRILRLHAVLKGKYFFFTIYIARPYPLPPLFLLFLLS